MTQKNAALQKQIDEKRKQIHTDQYSISIGELANLYKDGEIDIHPEFQRFFRWSPEQKSRFIESILLGIPIPSLFVSQRPDAKWDVVDGLQRLSTIFQLMGILRDEKDRLVPALILTETKYLPALKDKQWSGGNDALTPTQQLLIKRSKLDLKIVLRESDDSAKFELFQRLNTGGSDLSPQEIRNAMLVATNADVHRWLKTIAAYEPFRDCILLSERQVDEQFDVELALRFILLRSMPAQSLDRIGDIGDFLTDKMMEWLASFDKTKENDEKYFKATFDLLASTVGQDAFRRYDQKRDRHTSGTLISGFEAVALGVGFHISGKKKLPGSKLAMKIKQLWKTDEFVMNSGSGVRASIRIPAIVRLGRKVFKP